MRSHGLRVFPLLTATILWAVAAIAQGETWSLDLKQLDARDQSRGFSNRMDYILRATSPQHFFLQMMPDGKGGTRLMGNELSEESFKKLVKKEPEYKTKSPFKGVAKLGTQEFAFALDISAAPASEAEKDEKAETDEGKKAAEGDSAIAKLKQKLADGLSAPKINAYDRLYFDRNHNGDLTDDEALSGDVQTGSYGGGQAYARISFPRLDVTIDADGTSVESSFFVSGNCHASADFNYTQIQINAGAYRDGEITLDGQKRRAVLVDFNSNGRFDDSLKVITITRAPGREEIYPQHGDMILIDPSDKNENYDSPYDVTTSSYRYDVSKLINLAGRFYDMTITPAGDKLTLEPSSAALGNVTNSNDGFRALIYDGDIALKISGDKNTPVPVPEGEWRLLSYTIRLNESTEPPKEEEKKAEEGKSAVKLLEDAIKAFVKSTPVAGSTSEWSVVTARGPKDYKPVKVVKGETVEMPFGPPYTPLVTSQNWGNPAELQLEMSLVGSAGETCSDMTVRGGRPGKPEFTITDPKGEVVQQGSFEYG